MSTEDWAKKLADELEKIDTQAAVDCVVLMITGGEGLDQENPTERDAEKMTSVRLITQLGLSMVMCKKYLIPLLRNCTPFSDDTCLEDIALGRK